MEGNTGIRNWTCLMHRARQYELLLLHMTSRSSALLLASVMFLWVSCSLSPTTTHAQFLITPASAAKERPSWGDILMDSSASGLLALEVVHRDAVNSPFSSTMRHGAATKEEVHRELEKRDQSRVFAIQKQLELKATAAAATTAPPSLTDPVKPGISAGSGEYFGTLQVGTPPKTILATLDTGSDVFWLQCEPCEECYQQIGPIFDPTQSSSYTALKCSSPECASLDTYQCGKVSGLCLYEVAYGDGSVTVGDFSQETITLTSTSSGNPFQIPQFAFGCGHMNNGNFGGSAGILGLGRGKLSFPSQLQALGQQAAVSFMYCLTDRFSNPSANSHIVFGESASITPALGIQYTPLLQNPHLPAYYYVGLMGISVGLAVIQFPVSFYLVDAATGNGGVILDSGTSISQLTELAYISFRGAFQAATTHLQTAPGTALLDTCYTIVSGNLSTVAIPPVSFLFENKVSITLPPNNVLMPVDSHGTYCLAFGINWTGNFSIIGNLQQQNFLIEYDLTNSRVGFLGADCAITQ